MAYAGKLERLQKEYEMLYEETATKYKLLRQAEKEV